MTPEQLGPMTTVVPGHDSCGDIVAIGEGVTDREIGQRVMGYLKVGCMDCEWCAMGIPAHCKRLRSIGRQIGGADAEYMVIPSWAALPVPDWMSYQAGAIVSCNYGTAYSAVMRVTSVVPKGGTVVVFGVGPVGLCAVMTSAALGYRTIAVDVSPARLEIAKKFGAVETINGREVDSVEAIRELTAGEGFHAAIECSGTDIAQIQAMEAGGRMSKVVLVGNGAAQAMAPLGTFKAKEMSMEGSVVFDLTEVDDMIAFIHKHDLKLDDLVDVELPIQESAKAFALADAGNSTKIMFAW
jgi:propanol-preferring alcohol dehydrogenase